VTLLPNELVRKIHDAPAQLVLALNGGSRAAAELLETPGGSRTLLEATVPYSEKALVAWLGSRPEQFCAARTARAMAVVAFGRALRYGAAEDAAAGVASSASLASDRPKRGPHRAHVAVQTRERTACWSLELQKAARSRAEEEQIVARMVLNAAAAACRLADRLELPLLEGERVDEQQATAPQPWQDLFLGRAEVVAASGAVGQIANLPPSQQVGNLPPDTIYPATIFPGAFNPLHAGHRRMAEIAAEILGRPVTWEISILNVDKPALDYIEIRQRLAQFPPEHAVWLTRAATFAEKSRLFPGATFVVGADTLQRIVDPRYYSSPSAFKEACEQIIARGCRFLVFGRALDAGFVRLSDVSLPFGLHRACSEVPPETFREDVSSTGLRNEVRTS
jgi:nicotinamide mononucleotide (NMN) deamidase PncC